MLIILRMQLGLQGVREKVLKADSPAPSDSDGNAVSSPNKLNSVCTLFLIIYLTCICIGLLTVLCILGL